MRTTVLPLAGILLAIGAVPASAASLIVTSNSVTADLLAPGGLPLSWQVVTSATNGSGLSGLQSNITFSLEAVDAWRKVFTLSYTLDNTSTGAGSQSTIAVFGFDIGGEPDPNLTVTEGSFVEGSGGNFNGAGKREFCLFEGSNCNGGGNSGVRVSDVPVAGKFTLTYATAQNAIVLSNFTTRWQRTGANAQGSASGIGTPTQITAVPEPATWAMMLVGFGFVAGAMRSRRGRQKVTVSYA